MQKYKCTSEEELEQERLIDALNLIEEQASQSGEATREELEERGKAYDLLFNHLTKTKEISIPFSDEDLDRLKNGDSFDWTFDGIKVSLFNEEYNN